MFRHAIGRLRRDTRVVAVDLPGFGYGDAPIVPGRAFSRGAELLRAFIEERDLRDLVVVAHATAGPMVLGAVADAPERVRALVVTNSFAWPLVGAPGKLGRIAAVVSSRLFGWLGVRSGFLGWVTARFSRRGGRYTPEEARAIGGPLRRRAVREHLANVLRSLRGDATHLEALPARICASLAHLPTLFLYGMHDNGYRAGLLDRWRGLLARHRVQLLERSGHFPPEDEPEAYTAALVAFVEEVAERE